MKKLIIISNESVFTGSAKSGVGEMTDSLANSVGREYDTIVICPDGKGILTKFPGNMRKYDTQTRTCRVFGVTYYMVEYMAWPNHAWKIADTLDADIIHNLANVDGYTQLTKRPSRMIFSFDRKESIENIRDIDVHLAQYDAVRTGSASYNNSLLRQRSTIGSVLANLNNFGGISNGIATPGYAPEKKLLITAKYSAEDQSGKQKCKDKLCKIYGIPNDKVLFLMMCDMCHEKGADAVLNQLHFIRDNGGFTLLVGSSCNELKNRFKSLTRADGVIWIPDRPNPIKAIPMMAAADFYLSPSITEPGGLMPMQASRYATVPIITPVDALADNFNRDNSIFIEDNLEDAIANAFSLYSDKEALRIKRKACMEQDFSWKNRKTAYLDLYEGI